MRKVSTRTGTSGAQLGYLGIPAGSRLRVPHGERGRLTLTQSSCAYGERFVCKCSKTRNCCNEFSRT
jgi:hypothetical protein